MDSIDRGLKLNSVRALHVPTISVVIPAYNSATMLPETLRSLLAQTVHPMEIIVVDDGSVDDTPLVLEQFGEAVTTIRKTNGGLASARHTGIAAARGEFVALMDADDLCVPNRLAVQAAFLAAHPEVLLCATDFSAFDDQGFFAESFASTYYSAIQSCPVGVFGIFPVQETLTIPEEVPVDGDVRSVPCCLGPVYEKLALGNFIHPPTVMFRRSVIDLVGNYDMDSRSMCDWDWFVRVSRAGPIGYIALPLLRYRISNTQMSSERHWSRRCLDTLHIFERTIRRDPDLYRQFAQEFERKVGSYCLDSADALSGEDGVTSLRWLSRSVFCHRYVSGHSFRVLVKALLPSRILRGLRNVRDVMQG
jgi:glycosyltransferase involved in cell wall biosynthesis